MARVGMKSKRKFPGLLLGIVTGLTVGVVVLAVVVAPLALTHRGAGAIETAYGGFAVNVASRFGGANTRNPLASDSAALLTGHNAYTASCAQCHGANGDGKGLFGQATFPPASDLTSRDTRNLSDGQMFGIIKNGLGFTAMPGYANQYSDEQIWSLVTYVRSLT